jgi:hypothetical protein
MKLNNYSLPLSLSPSLSLSLTLSCTFYANGFQAIMQLYRKSEIRENWENLREGERELGCNKWNKETSFGTQFVIIRREEMDPTGIICLPILHYFFDVYAAINFMKIQW